MISANKVEQIVNYLDRAMSEAELLNFEQAMQEDQELRQACQIISKTKSIFSEGSHQSVEERSFKIQQQLVAEGLYDRELDLSEVNLEELEEESKFLEGVFEETDVPRHDLEQLIPIAFQQIEAQTSKQKPAIIRRLSARVRFLSIAASVLLLIVAGFIISYFMQNRFEQRFVIGQQQFEQELKKFELLGAGPSALFDTILQQMEQKDWTEGVKNIQVQCESSILECNDQTLQFFGAVCYINKGENLDEAKEILQQLKTQKEKDEFDDQTAVSLESVEAWIAILKIKQK